MREMKDSGVEWIGEIPKDWKLSKTKYFYDCYFFAEKSSQKTGKCERYYLDKINNVCYT